MHLESGFSLMEAIVATVITVIAVIAMAYTFGMGRAFINGFEVRRIADARAQGVMEVLGALPAGSDSLTIGTHFSSTPFTPLGTTAGSVRWTVSTATDVPAGITGVLRDVTVTVRWTFASYPDSVLYSRALSAP